jgi:hypothetical protein
MTCEPSRFGGRFQRNCHVLVRALEERGYAVQLRWLPASTLVQRWFANAASVLRVLQTTWRSSSSSGTAAAAAASRGGGEGDARARGNEFHRAAEEAAETVLVIALLGLACTRFGESYAGPFFMEFAHPTVSQWAAMDIYRTFAVYYHDHINARLLDAFGGASLTSFLLVLVALAGSVSWILKMHEGCVVVSVRVPDDLQPAPQDELLPFYHLSTVVGILNKGACVPCVDDATGDTLVYELLLSNTQGMPPSTPPYCNPHLQGIYFM